LVNKFQFINHWIQKNPTLFSLGIILNVSLIYLYRNGYFLEFYNLIRNLPPVILDITEKFSSLFEDNSFKNLAKRVHRMDPTYFTSSNRRMYSWNFLDIKYYIEHELALEPNPIEEFIGEDHRDIIDDLYYWNRYENYFADDPIKKLPM